MPDARLTRATIPRRARRDPRLRLVDRDHELAALSEVVESASTGLGACVVLEGAAGMGKSRLLAETSALARSRHLSVLSARALPRDQTVPFSLALALFAPVVARADAARRERYLDGAAQLAGPLLSGQPLTGAASSAPLQYGLFWLAVNITQTTPIAVLVDDAHWADEASLHFLAQVARSVHELPAAVVIGTRPTDGGTSPAMFDLFSSGPVSFLPVSPLSATSVAELVREQFPEADDAFCRVCAEVTSGNPFHLSELLHCIHDEHPGATLRAADLGELGRMSVSRAALFRLARLGGAAVAVARALAVLGDDTPLRRVAALAGLSMDAAAAAADALAAEGLVRPGGVLSFTHPLIPELILAERPPLSVAQDHARAAALLAADHEPVEKRAAHLLHAPAAGDQAAVDTLARAAAVAISRGAPEIAAGYLARALEEPPAAGRRRELLCRLGAAGGAVGDPAAVRHLERALELSDTAADRAAVRRLIARALAATGRPREAALCLETAVQELTAGSAGAGRAAAAEVMPLVAEYLTYSVLESGLRRRALDLAGALLDPDAGDDDAASRAVVAVLAMRSAQEGRPVAETARLAERAWAGGSILADDTPDRSPWLTVNWAFALAGDYRQAVKVATAARNEARRLGLAEVAATASVFRTNGLLALGNITAGREEIEFVLQAAERERWHRYRVAALSIKAMLCVEAGEPEDAAAALRAADAFGEQTGIETAWRSHARGTLALAGRDAAAALDAFTAAGAWLRDNLGADDLTILPWRPAAARAALALGEPGRARELITPDRDLALAIGDHGRLGRALAVLALVERDNEPVMVLQEACELLTESGELLERARARKDLGCLLRTAGDRAGARAALTTALDTASRLGATALARALRDELASAGARPRTDRTSGPRSLTPSERRIATLVAGGLTNGRIAQELFVTPKTVEYHLRNVFQKLGVSRRADVAAALTAADPD